MEAEVNPADQGRKIMGWTVPEYDQPDREQGWYALAVILGLIFLVHSFLNGNFLFAVIIIIGAFIIIMRDGREPMPVNFSLTDEGVIIGKRFYDYDEIKNFAIVYKPHQGVKNLYFEFKSAFKQRLSIPLNNQNPLPIRENLLRYLPEDLERTDQPLSEALAKLFKL